VGVSKIIIWLKVLSTEEFVPNVDARYVWELICLIPTWRLWKTDGMGGNSASVSVWKGFWINDWDTLILLGFICQVHSLSTHPRSLLRSEWHINSQSIRPSTLSLVLNHLLNQNPRTTPTTEPKQLYYNYKVFNRKTNVTGNKDHS